MWCQRGDEDTGRSRRWHGWCQTMEVGSLLGLAWEECPAPGQKPRLAPRSSVPVHKEGARHGVFSLLSTGGSFAPWPGATQGHPLPNLRGEGLASRPILTLLSSFVTTNSHLTSHLWKMEYFFLPYSPH